MELLTVSFVTILSDADPPADDPVYFIVPRHRAYLAALLAESFGGREGMEIIVDRRYAERRQGVGAEARRQAERRQKARRRPKQELVEVVIEGSRPGDVGHGPP